MDVRIVSPAPVASIVRVMQRVHGADFERVFGKKIADVIDDEVTFGITVDLDEGPVTSMIVHLDPPVLFGLCTDPDHQQRGFASQAIDRAITEICERNPDATIYTAVHHRSVWVADGYKRRGFELLHDNAIEDHLLLRRRPAPPPI